MGRDGLAEWRTVARFACSRSVARSYRDSFVCEVGRTDYAVDSRSLRSRQVGAEVVAGLIRRWDGMVWLRGGQWVSRELSGRVLGCETSALGRVGS